MVEEEFTRKLIKPSEEGLEVNLDETAILKADKSAIASYYSTLLQNGVLCVNEVRRELGFSPIEGGDKHTVAYTDISQNTIGEKRTADFSKMAATWRESLNRRASLQTNRSNTIGEKNNENK